MDPYPDPDLDQAGAEPGAAVAVAGAAAAPGAAIPAGAAAVAPADAAQVGGAAPADERRWQYQELSCKRCGAVVLAAKFSAQHTSVQWSAVATRRCAEFTARAAAGETSALVPACASLAASITHAVARGQLRVLPP